MLTDAAADTASAGVDWWATWGSLIGSVVVALIALGGVVWATLHNSKQNRLAEDQRAQAAIDAEDRRHAHSLEAEQRARLTEARHALYVRMEAIRGEISDVVRDWDPDAHFGTRLTDDEVPYWAERVKQLEVTLERFDEIGNEAALYASREVSQRWFMASLQCLQAQTATELLLDQRTKEHAEAASQHSWTALHNLDAINRQMRSELGAD